MVCYQRYLPQPDSTVFNMLMTFMRRAAQIKERVRGMFRELGFSSEAEGSCKHPMELV